MINLTVIQKIHDFLWGIPLISLILFVGIYLTIKLKLIQIRKLPKALKLMLKKEENAPGEVSTFQALCISLSATLGTGNITGVASAISIGGPGALIWMIISAIFGMATKYAEGFLSVKYRKYENDRLIGGPYAYIEYGMGKKFKPLAISFAIFGLLASIMGVGTLTQINGITDASKNIFDHESLNVITIFNQDISIVSVISGLIITILSGIILIGGIKRVGRICELLVPFMALIYITISIIIIFSSIEEVPSAIKMMFKMAFSNKALSGGVIGYTVKTALQQGIAKGVLSHEAGLGSAPIATSTAKSNNPVEQGLVAMTSTFIGTIIICTLTGITVILTKAYQQNLSGILISDYTFNVGLFLPPLVSSILLLLSITCFAFTTIIGWNVYGVRCLDYITNGNKKIELVYQWIYIIMIFLGSFLEVNLIWNIAEIINALMAIPNLIAILFLTNIITKETNEYNK